MVERAERVETGVERPAERLLTRPAAKASRLLSPNLNLDFLPLSLEEANPLDLRVAKPTKKLSKKIVYQDSANTSGRELVIAPL